MSAILYVASIATTYHKPSLKRSYKENEFTKFANPNKQKVEALKKEFNSLKFDFIIDKPFFGKGIRNYKYSFNHNDYIERENHLQSRSANGRDIHIYKDENGKKYIYHYSLIERECDYHQYCLIIDGKTYNINQGLTRLELTPGVHKVEFVCDIDIVYGTQTKRLKFNKTQYVYLRDGYNYYSISTDFKEGFIGVHFNSYNHQEYGDFKYRLDTYDVNSGYTDINFVIGIVTHESFYKTHINKYYTYEVSFPDSDPNDLKDIQKINSFSNDVLRVSNSIKSKSVSSDKTSNVETKTVSTQEVKEQPTYTQPKVEKVEEPKVYHYYDNPKLSEIMSAYDYDLYTNGMVINKLKMMMTYLTIPVNVIKIGPRAFVNAKSLQTVEFLKDVVSVGNSAFLDCVNIYSLKLNEGLVEINDCAFNGCKKLKTVKIPKSVKYIGASAFRGTSITEVVVPEGCYVHENAFNDDTIVVYGTEYDLNKYKEKIKKQKEQEALAMLAEINKRLAEIDKVEAALNAIEEAEKEAERQKELEEKRQQELEKRRIEREKKKQEKAEKDRLEAIKKAEEELALYQELSKDDEQEQANKKKFGSSFDFMFNELIKYKGNSKTVTIPDFINKFRSGSFVDSNIEELIINHNILTDSLEVLKELSNVKVLHLPPNIESIPKGLFKNFKNLEYVNIPSTVKEIEDSAFENCESLKYVEFVGDFKSLKIGNKAFKKCVSLKELVLPKNTTIICEEAFMNCKELDTLLLAFETEKIQTKAFAGCVHLTKMVFPPKVNYLGDDLFDKCNMVEEVFLCGKRYFSGNNLPLDGLNIYTKIYHLIPLSEMKELLKPWEYKKISKLTNLDEVVLLHEIEREDLSNKLYKEIHCEAPIVETNKKLGDTLFYKKTSLEKKGIDTPNKSKEYKIEPNKKEVKVEEAPIFEIKNQILVKYNGDCETVTIPLDVKEVLVNAFNGKNVKTIIYNGNGVNLGWFSEINSLEELILGDNIKEVSNNRSGYKKLKYIKFGKKINYIPLSSLSSVKQLEKVEFEAKDIRICDRAFSNCKNLKEVIGDGISYIDDYTFMGCESLVKIDLSNLIRIGRESFKDCSSLKEFTFGSKLNLIDKDILVNCKSLEVVNFYTEPSNISKLYLPLSFKSILSGCDNIKEFNHTASRADLLPYFNDEKGRLWKVPFKMVRVKK